MVRMYCRKNEEHQKKKSEKTNRQNDETEGLVMNNGMSRGMAEELCADCLELLEYAHKRLDHCKFGNEKTSCQKCQVHCYKPEMRERIRTVMRFSGPRMMLYHPIIAIRHLFE